MQIRELEVIDYSKNYLGLLSQLTFVGEISYQDFRNQLSKMKEDYFIYVIEEEQTIIVSGSLLIENKFIHQCGRVGHIEDIVVDNNRRGRGLGKKIVEFLIEKAKEHGCYKVILNCENSNKIFYEKMGFINKNLEMSFYF